MQKAKQNREAISEGKYECRRKGKTSYRIKQIQKLVEDVETLKIQIKELQEAFRKHTHIIETSKPTGVLFVDLRREKE